MKRLLCYTGQALVTIGMGYLVQWLTNGNEVMVGLFMIITYTSLDKLIDDIAP